MRSLKSKVLWILEHFEKSRNDDKYLVIKLWKEFFIDSGSVQNPFPINDYFQLLSMLTSLPKYDDIIRWRRRIQSPVDRGGDGLYLPTSTIVLRSRRLLEPIYLTALGYDNKIT